ncbi:hypothetical protein C1646_773050 [Rhizophagus diaphanus]|nr:hypothetical protein C1646_773050 [Rhizophagus diaphanus] [Rhizophagus sp. MUCL 43196]
MDPGEVLDELQNLTKIEEMLIARVFPMMLVYRLRGGQHGYHVLVIRYHSASNPEAFRDFRVHRNKIIHALNWLKENNRYYADIIIDHEVLRSLPIALVKK